MERSLQRFVDNGSADDGTQGLTVEARRSRATADGPRSRRAGSCGRRPMGRKPPEGGMGSSTTARGGTLLPAHGAPFFMRACTHAVTESGKAPSCFLLSRNIRCLTHPISCTQYMPRRSAPPGRANRDEHKRCCSPTRRPSLRCHTAHTTSDVEPTPTSTRAATTERSRPWAATTDRSNARARGVATPPSQRPRGRASIRMQPPRLRLHTARGLAERCCPPSAPRSSDGPRARPSRRPPRHTLSSWKCHFDNFGERRPTLAT